MRKNRFRQLEEKLKQRDKTELQSGISKSFVIEDFKKFGYEPNKQQTKIHQSLANYILIIAGPGSGKTATLIIEILKHLLKYPNSRGFLGRQNESEFDRTILNELNKWILKIPFVEKHIVSKNKIIFENKSELLYGGLYEGIQKLKGMELSIFGIDQCEELSEELFKVLAERLRRLDIPERKGLLTINIAIPEWVRKRFIENPEIGHEWFPLYPQENKFVPDDYIDNLKNIWGDEYFKAIIKCDLNYIQTENNVFDRNELKDVFQNYRKESSKNNRTIGCDPARSSGDECVISEKINNNLRIIEAYRNKTTDYTIERLKKIAGNKQIPICIDSGAFGAAIIDQLIKDEYNAIGIDFSSSPDDKRRFNIKKAEIIWKLKEDLHKLGIKHDGVLEKQFGDIRYKILNTEKIAIETKEERRRRGLPSADRLMSIALANLEETEKIEVGEDKKGTYEIDENGKKIYFENYYYSLNGMIERGKIGECEIAEDPNTISDYDFQRLTMPTQNLIRINWAERKKEWNKYLKKWKKSKQFSEKRLERLINKCKY